MRPYSIGGVILMVLGVLMLAVHSVTYFTNDQVTGPLGFFTWNVNEPHTIFFNPIFGAVALIAGIVLVFMAPRRRAL